MKPASFQYYCPETLDETLELLETNGFDAKILSGGQSLIPMMNMRLARPKILVDINRLYELEIIQIKDDFIHIGGLTRHYQIENSKELKNIRPILPEAMKFVGHSQIRSRGTIGGSLVHADPTAEWPVVLALLDGTITLQSLDGQRTLDAEEFFLTYLTTTIEPNEVLVSVQIPRAIGKTGEAMEEFTLRSGDFAIVLAAAAVTIDDSGKVKNARLALGGVDGVPVVLDEITDLFTGKVLTDDVIEQSTKSIVDFIDPEGDIHASGEYRKDLAVTLSNRVLKKAYQRALTL